MLVETSALKSPKENNMGTSEDVLFKGTSGNGHVSRNIRLCVSAIDMVEPYLSIVGVNELTVVDDVVPLKALSCDDVPIVYIAPGADQVTINRSVGGAMEIDTSRLWVMNSDEVEVEGDCNYKPPMDDPYDPFKGAQRGAGYISLDTSHVVGSSPLNPMFSAVVDVSQLADDGKLMVIASARVDKGWLNQPFDILPPQAHLQTFAPIQTGTTRVARLWREDWIGSPFPSRLFEERLMKLSTSTTALNGMCTT